MSWRSGRHVTAWPLPPWPGRSTSSSHGLQLTHLAEANPFTLSGGEKRRLSVATALATSPTVLVLDEPTFGQDRRTWVELVELLARHRDDGGAICRGHPRQAVVTSLADRVLKLGCRDVVPPITPAEVSA